MKKLSKIHRTGNKGLLEFIDNFHELAGYKVTCSEDEYRKMHYKVEDIATRNVGEFEPKSIKDLENEFSNSLLPECRIDWSSKDKYVSADFESSNDILYFFDSSLALFM